MIARIAILCVVSVLAGQIAFADQATPPRATTRPVTAGGEIRFDGSTFTEAIDYLRDISKANIFVNWNQLEAAGIDRNVPINLRVHNIRFGKLLQLVLDSADPRLKYTAYEGVISVYVSQYPPDPAGKVTHVYEITDLMFPVPELQDLTSGGGTGTSGTSGNSRQGTASNNTSGRSGGSGSSNRGRY